ncbi:MAG: hypothetical protein HC930_14525 [Hydrococcus sp. SU_1_0]|nr:hypothetical protein [Hydrococcus sp. SU_1_0]NJM63783.1 hypothetical protein [Oscillatoriales cyanobacterium RU_3_3]
MSKSSTSNNPNSATTSIETIKKAPTIPSIDSLKKILQRHEARIFEAQLKAQQLRADITSRQQEQDEKQREIIAGRMLLSWVNSPGKLTQSEFLSCVDKFLDSDSPDRALFGLDLDSANNISATAKELEELEEQLNRN